jgi:hypothetical protein
MTPGLDDAFVRDIYIQLISAKIDRLEKYLTVLKSKNYTNVAPYILIEILLDLLSKLNENMDSVLDPQLPTLHSFLSGDFSKQCTLLERATPSYVPWSLIPILEHIYHRHIEPDSAVLLRADPVNTYIKHNDATLTSLIEDVGTFLGIDLTGEYNCPKVFTIPLLEKCNVLLHSILFHELGHHYAELFLKSIDIDSMIRSTIDHSDGNRDVDIFTPYKASVILKGLLKEVFCDIYAYYVCGFPIIYSLYYYTLLHPMGISYNQIESSYHPSFKFRLRTINDLATRDGIYSYYQDSSPNIHRAVSNMKERIDELLKENNDIDALKEKPFGSVAFDAFSSSSELIQSYIMSIDNLQSKANLRKPDGVHIENIYKCINAYIPPCYVDNSIPRVNDVLMAGWCSYINSFEDINMKNIQDHVQTINFIILKSFTQIEFMRKYNASGSDV